MTAQPAWQLPITHGFAVGLGMKRNDLFKEHRFGAGDILDRLAGHRIGREADEVAGVPRLHRNPDFTVGLETANAGPMSGSRIHHHEGAALHVDLDTLRRNDAHQQVVDRPLQGAPVDHQLGRIIKDMRNRLGQMLAILIAALPHDVHEQHAALGRIHQVLEGGAEKIGERAA